MFWAASFVPERNILRPRPQVTLLPLSRLRSLPLLILIGWTSQTATPSTAALPLTHLCEPKISAIERACRSHCRSLGFGGGLRRLGSRHGIALGLIIVIRAVRSASASAISFAASFAVLRFEPHTTMPPNNADTAAAIIPRSNRIAPTSSRPTSLSARPERTCGSSRPWQQGLR
jgi:hypothetical protein